MADDQESPKLDRTLGLEIVRVTEATAIAAARLRGRGDEAAADSAAITAMYRELARLPLHGVIVARQRAMPRGAACNHLEAGRNFFRGLDMENRHSRWRRQNVRILVECELGIDLLPGMLHHPRRA